MSYLKKARSLEFPQREETLNRGLSVQRFWNDNCETLSNAWKEWDESHQLPKIDNSLIDTGLRKSVENTWKNPQQESSVKDLLKEVSAGVYQFQLFDPAKLEVLRKYLAEVEKAQIPLRAPYGIVLNRKGAMLDQRSEGYLAAPSFQKFYQGLMDIYMRPIARLLFPEIVGYDTQTFGFSIQYQAGKDTSIRMHTDASSVTLNINLNLVNEKFEGSEVDFHDPVQKKINRVTFEPGMALIHRGNVAHQAHPILSGERTNFVMWLYGDGMLIPRQGNRDQFVSAEERWKIPEAEYERFAPF